MLILGLTKTTLLDYPGKVAATIFTGGCNFRCPFCHNGNLVLNPSLEPAVSEEEVFEHLIKRKNVLEGVCVSGGEPTIQGDLPEFLSKIKALGYLIKLDTNGMHPEIIQKLIEDKLVDYIAMDIKNTYEKYEITSGIKNIDVAKIKQSIDYLINGALPYEFRTTLVKEYHQEEDIMEMARMISGADTWYLQSFKDSDYVIKKGLAAYTKEEISDMTNRIENLKITIRGLD